MPSSAIAPSAATAAARSGTPGSLLARLLPFLPYVLVSVFHVTLLTFEPSHALAGPTKLLLMPLLVVAVLWASASLRPWPWPVVAGLVFAVLMSWFGDGAGTFFPSLPELPMMLLCFGIAHLAYMWLFWRAPALLRRRRLPLWASLYGAWWIMLVLIIGPSTGSLLVPVMIYGVVLGGTAALSSRCSPVIAWGGFWFLVSDTILAFRIFMTDLLPTWAGGAVMLTYCLGQGLIGFGIVQALRTRRLASSES